MKAIILSGGEGRKIWPYNKYWQKCCLPVGNIPNIKRIINQLRILGIDDITLLTGYMEHQVKYILRHEKNLKYISCLNDTMGKTIAEIAKGGPSIVYYGDVYAEDKDVSRLIDCYKENGNSVMVKPMDYENPEDNICAFINNGILEGIYGHPRRHYVNTKICGIFIADEGLLSYAGINPGTFLNVPVGGMPPKGFYFEQSIQTAIEDGYKIYGLNILGDYVDIDFPWDILTANQYYCKSIAGSIEKNYISSGAEISEKATVSGNITLGENSYIGDRVVIEGNLITGSNVYIDNGAIIGKNCVIGSNTIIRDYCKISAETVIGNKNKVGFSAEVTGVTFDNVSMVHNSEIYGVVGRGTDIAAGVQMGIMRFDDMESSQKAPVKKYSGKNVNAVFIGDHCRTGIGNLFVPGIKIGSNSALGPGLIVTKDIAENKLVLVNQSIIETDWDHNRYGW